MILAGNSRERDAYAEFRALIETFAAPGEVLLLICRISGETFAITASAVERVLRMPALTVMPGAPEAIAGTVNVEGTFLPVVDARAVLNLSRSMIEPEQHLIVLNASERFALWVDRASDTQLVSTAEIQQAPGPLSAFAPYIAHLGESCVAVLDAAELAPHSWQRGGASGL